jgi:DNA-binding response OmpR family regulator
MGSMKKVLVCDNDYDFLELLTIFLRSKGYDFYVIQEGSQVLPILKQNKFKLLLLDLNLPDIQGEKIIEKIRAESEIGPIQIVVITGSILAKDDIDQLDVNGFIEKPFELQKLEEIIKEKLGEE